jgi:phosphoribosylformylglycinamidine (FGAM) synthase-like enzyme
MIAMDFVVSAYAVRGPVPLVAPARQSTRERSLATTHELCTLLALRSTRGQRGTIATVDHATPGAAGIRRAEGAEEPLHRALGLTDDEASTIAAVLGRAPNDLELAMFAVMWSEHCSYKSSRVHLRRLPSDGPHVLVGPGENAGVVDAGDGVAVAIRIESHNHPSAIEPRHGAATGVGGIIRDVLAAGARPIALLDALFVGELDEERSRWLLEGVVSGISWYGNAIGVPTVGGELTLASTYRGNPLVNVCCVGVAPKQRLGRAQATGPGNLVVLLGATTGRDGIGGVSVLASAGLAAEADDAAKRPSVQVGDPLEGKRLIEACLELVGAGVVVGVQDLGGAGLTCAASETAARAGTGIDLFLSEVPRREPGMTPAEVMTSESQERMLLVVEPEAWGVVEEVCRRREVRASVVGEVTASTTDGGMLRVFDRRGGRLLAEVPARALALDAPLYERPVSPPAWCGGRRVATAEEREALASEAPVATRSDAASRRLRGPDAASPAEDLQERASARDPAALAEDLLGMLLDESWVYEQYDRHLFLNMLVEPPADAALLRLAAPELGDTGKAIALAVDSCPRWCAIDPRRGAAMVVAESALNVACVGARPVALVDCLNFGNPEHPEVIWQLSEAIDGIAAACRALELPVVGGNVSLYNEYDGIDIDPTPVVATLGFVESRPPAPIVGSQTLRAGGALVLLGVDPAWREATLTGSLWEATTRPSNLELPHHGRPGAAGSDLGAAGSDLGASEDQGAVELPALDLTGHARLVAFVAEAVGERAVLAAHDVASGGLMVALAELAAWSGVGVEAALVGGPAALLCEAPSRVVVVTEAPSALAHAARRAGLVAEELGRLGGDRLVVEGLLDVPVFRLEQAAKRSLRRWFEPSSAG